MKSGKLLTWVNDEGKFEGVDPEHFAGFQVTPQGYVAFDTGRGGMKKLSKRESEQVVPQLETWAGVPIRESIGLTPKPAQASLSKKA